MRIIDAHVHLREPGGTHKESVTSGTAAALAQELRLDLAQVPADRLRVRLAAQHVQLTHPMGPALLHYLRSSP